MIDFVDRGSCASPVHSRKESSNVKKGTFSNIILILMLLLGLSLLLYPTFADYWNSLHQTRAIATYAEEVAVLDDDKYIELWEDAIAYNKTLSEKENQYYVDDESLPIYESLLNITGSGIMGSIEIPSIGCSLPIYHGVDESVLQVAVGHLEWTSLPTGGESTHCVMSGHRGLPSARLFTDLDQLQPGDTFMLHILDETLTYEVDQILIVLPHETDALLIEEGKDLCTLVTCTPYGVNSHRLLVRGHRVENEAQAVIHRVTADALQVEPIAIAVVLFFPILILLLILSSILEKLFRSSRNNTSER